MKKMILIVIFLGVILSTSVSVWALSPPFKHASFDSVQELADWIKNVDYQEADSGNFRGDLKYHYKPFLELLRKDSTLLIPKYKGQDFPINVEEGYTKIDIVPNQPYEQRSYSFHGNVSDTRFTVSINRIEDEYVNLAKTDYDKYLSSCDPKPLLNNLPNNRMVVHKVIDNYDVMIHFYSDEIDNDIVDSITLHKVSLADLNSVSGQYSMEGNTVHKKGLLVFVLPGVGIVLVIAVFICVVMGRKKRRLRA
jgi:hypothetical protein